MTASARGLIVIPVAVGHLLVKRGVTEVLVTGDDALAVVQPLLDLLDTTSDVDEAVSRLPEEQQVAGQRLADALVARHMLIDERASEALAVDPMARAFYANFGTAGREAAQAVRHAHIAVHGRGVIGAHVVASLADIGVGRITVVDDPRLVNPFATGVIAAESRVRDESIGDRDDRSDDGDVDLVIAASDLGQEEALLEVGRSALVAERPFLPVWLSELVGFVGPLTRAYETPCLRCYQLRVDANDRHLLVRRARRQHWSEDPAIGGSSGFLTPMAAVVAHIAAMEAAIAVGRFAPESTVSRSIEINLVSFRCTVRRVLKVPRCPDCGASARHGPRVMTVGPQITE